LDIWRVSATSRFTRVIVTARISHKCFPYPMLRPTLSEVLLRKRAEKFLDNMIALCQMDPMATSTHRIDLVRSVYCNFRA
jgi:hypothetical protein